MDKHAILAMRHWWRFSRSVSTHCGLRRKAFQHDYEMVKSRVYSGIMLESERDQL